MSLQKVKDINSNLYKFLTLEDERVMKPLVQAVEDALSNQQAFSGADAATAVAAANAAIPASARFIGMKVIIIDESASATTPIEYWYSGGVGDEHLVVRPAIV